MSLLSPINSPRSLSYLRFYKRDRKTSFVGSKLLTSYHFKKIVGIHRSRRTLYSSSYTAVANSSHQVQNGSLTSAITEPQPIEPESPLTRTLKSIHSAFQNPGTANADQIIKNFRQLDSLGVLIPQCLWQDVVELLAKRRDVYRVELIIHIATINVNANTFRSIDKLGASSLSNQPSQSPSSNTIRSLPSDDPINQLVSFSVSGLMRYGCTEEALRLWVRMANDGYTTNRESLEQMMDRIIRKKCVPSAEFIDKLHSLMKHNMWNQNPEYYTRILAVCRQFILSHDSTYGGNPDIFVLSGACEQFQSIWEESVKMSKGLEASNGTTKDVAGASPTSTSYLSVASLTTPSPATIETAANRLGCWTAAMTVCAKIPNEAHELEHMTVHAMGAFSDLIQLYATNNRKGHLHRLPASSNHLPTDASAGPSHSDSLVSTASTASTATVLTELTSQIQAILNSSDKTVSNIQPTSGIVEDNKGGVGRDELLLRSLQFDGGVVYPRATVASLAGSTNSLRATGLVRDAVMELLTQLSAIGQSEKALRLLEEYLQAELNLSIDGSRNGDESTRKGVSFHGSRSTEDDFHCVSMLSNTLKSSKETTDRLVAALAAVRSTSTVRPPSVEHPTLPSAEPSALSQTSSNAGNHSMNPSPTSYHFERRSERAEFVHDKATVEWLSYLLGEVTKSCRMRFQIDQHPVPQSAGSTGTSATISGLIVNGQQGEASFEGLTFKTLREQSHRIQSLGDRYGIKLHSSVYFGNYIQSVQRNAHELNDLCSPHRPTHTIPFTAALAEAYQVVDLLEDSVGRSPVVYDSIVRLLVSYKEPAAVMRALELTEEMTSVEQCRVLPSTLTAILEAATYCLEDADLSKVLATVEDRLLVALEQQERTLDSDKDKDKEALVDSVRARIYANARLKRGYESLSLLRKLRRLGGKTQRRTYHWIIHALYLARPDAENEWRVAKDPSATVEYISREMQRDGIEMNEHTASLLLKLFTKACQISCSQGRPQAVLNRAEKFVDQCRSTGHLHHRKIAVSEGMVRELIKGYCMVGFEEKAILLLESAENKYGVKPSAYCFEPIVFNYAVLKAAPNVTEDVLMMIINRGLTLTDCIVDSLVLCHIRHSEHKEALDRIVDCYNQHKVKPTINTVLRVLDANLAAGDEFEARRVVSVIAQLYSPEERNKSVSLANPPADTDINRVPNKASEGDMGVEKFDSMVSYSRSSTSSSPRESRDDRIEDYDDDNYDDDADHEDKYAVQYGEEEDEDEEDERDWMGARIKVGTPFGHKEKGVLSEESLHKRFRRSGLSLSDE